MKNKQTAAPAAVSAPVATVNPVATGVNDAVADAEALALAEKQAAEAQAAEDKVAAEKAVEAKANEDEAIARSKAVALAESDAEAAARLKGYSGPELVFPLTLTLRNNGPIPLSEPATYAYLHAGGSSDVTIHDANHLTLVRQNLEELAAVNFIDPALLVIDGLPS